jgi:pSer/pThr/pTyr-binding forkhead associated (FHA) protein
LERVYDPNSLEAMTPTQPILIMNNVITLGTDPTKATLILEEPSIAAQHARMRRDREGNFYVLDFGTVAGTWINYSQTSGKEIRIEHGDLIHLGRVGFRFRLSKPPKAYEPVISFEK